MLVVSRKKGDSILIGDDIEITVIEAGDGNVRIGIKAPKNIKILRKELLKDIIEENRESIKNIDEFIKRIK